MFTKRKRVMRIVLTGAISLAVLSLAGCNKEPVTTESAETAKEAEAENANLIEQKLCPVMGGEINKELYTEYQGKKVYFCCPGCEKKFKAEPEKYMDKLPQFK